METRFLSVDWALPHPEIHRETFFGRSSFCAYDAVLIDPETVSRHWVQDVGVSPDGTRWVDGNRDHGLGRTLLAWMSKRRLETEDLLKQAGGVVVCRLRPRGEPLAVVMGDGPAEHVDRYSWLPCLSLADRHHQLVFPSNGRFVPRRGRDVVLQEGDSPFLEYMERLRGHFVYDAVYQDLLSTPLERFARVLARNKVGDVLAVEIPFEEGRLVLVPPTEGVSPSHEAAALQEAVDDMSHRPIFSAEPDWLPSYPLPGEDALRDEVERLRARHTALEEKLRELHTQWETSTRYKRMLYAKGRFSFLPSVADGFRALGFDVQVEDDILRLRAEQGDAIVVASAADGPKVEVPAYRRLLQRVDQAVTDGDGRLKGILVVNSSREMDPRRRGTQFSEAVLRGCVDQGYCLLNSTHLFRLVQEALGGSRKDLPKTRRRLLECEGEFRGAEDS